MCVHFFNIIHAHLTATLYVQYMDGNIQLMPGAQSPAARDKAKNSKQRKKEGTLYKLDGVYVLLDGESTLLPPVFITVTK